jgi:FkbM family methyltransferase
MIEKNGVLIHLEAKGDRTQTSALEFTGWVVSDKPVKAVWSSGEKTARLTTYERPDVKRVFPSRLALGFIGKAKGREIGPQGLRLAVHVDDETLEIDYPLPPPLPQRLLRARIVDALESCWLGAREWLTRDSSKRWAFALRRHLLYRRQRSGIFRRCHTDALLMDFANAVPDAAILQIGANDGFTGDPINHLLTRPGIRWRGVLVEPVAHLFAKLSERYAKYPELRLERAAICETDGMTVINRLQTGADDSLWLEQLPSLDADLLQSNARQFGLTNPPAIAENVPCFSVPTLLARHHLNALDLLVIDTEGWDWRILRQFDLKNLQPKLILYEHQHLSAQEREQAHQFLAKHEYGWAETDEGDTVAWRLR